MIERRYDIYGADCYDINEPSDEPMTEDEERELIAELDARYIVICDGCGEPIEHQGAHAWKGCPE